ncbi:MAG: CBS domain-containing protein [Nitrosopumilaceae archaeon]|nr:CBS domain-containing protein [Nitrosopumilaceae archaeon]NIP09865.1 CBS domain-containing protein [Nitrosopumilaceae archaeon]NIS94636.1 CBS domain-containing protein [Nitrosopumilaceae archaeon]
MGQVRDIMEKNVITIEHDKSALDASKLLKDKGISFVVITKNNDPIGLVSERDIVRKIAALDKKASEVSIEELMSKNFHSVKSQDDIEMAIQKMLNNNIRRLLVLDNEKLEGVITQTDLTSFLRSKLLINGMLEKLESD